MQSPRSVIAFAPLRVLAFALRQPRLPRTPLLILVLAAGTACASDRHVLRSMGEWDWREQVAAFTGPVLVVHSAQDNIPLAGSREWVEAFPDARLLLVEEAGHYPLIEAEPDVAEAIDRCLASRRASSGRASQSQPTPPDPVALPDTHFHEVASSYVDETYDIQVALPDGYAESTDKYPVVYVLDADRSHLDMLNPSLLKAQTLLENAAEAITARFCRTQRAYRSFVILPEGLRANVVHSPQSIDQALHGGEKWSELNLSNVFSSSPVESR